MTCTRDVAICLAPAGPASRLIFPLSLVLCLCPLSLCPLRNQFVLGTDVILLSACVVGMTAAAGSARLAVASYIFSAGCLIGAAEGVPKFISAVKGLVGA